MRDMHETIRAAVRSFTMMGAVITVTWGCLECATLSKNDLQEDLNSCETMRRSAQDDLNQCKADLFKTRDATRCFGADELCTLYETGVFRDFCPAYRENTRGVP